MKVQTSIGLIALLILCHAAAATSVLKCDLNGDGIVDHKDMCILMQDWHETVPTPTPPEPTATPGPPTATATETPIPPTPTSTPTGNLPPQATISLRSVSPQNQTDEGITTGLASGLSVVGAQTTVYLEGSGTDPEGGAITAYDWSITGPGLSVPITANVQSATFSPPREGIYTVSLVVTDSDGVQSRPANKEITAGKWMGIQNCSGCHNGGFPGLGDQVTGWEHTAHASMLARNLDDTEGHLAEHCISCHTVGYDTDALNGGFDDIAAQSGWTFPPTLEPGNWANIEQNYPELANVSNIQCENCHGPGSLHFGDLDRIEVSLDAGSCAVCHDALSHHTKIYEWDTSNHADPIVEESASCAPCHSGWGFVSSHDPDYAGVIAEHAPISCGVCHDPHAHDHEQQVRVADDVTLGNGVVVTEEEAGLGSLCINCHKSRRDVNEYVQEYHRHYGPHHGPQGDVLKGTGGYEYPGVEYTAFSPHMELTEDSCASCHMAEPPEGAPARSVGLHTFRMFAAAGTVEGVTEDVANLNACTVCHDGLTTLNRTAKGDYDGDESTEGINDEVAGLMDLLGALLPPLGDPAVDITEAYTADELKAVYNYVLAEEDRSGGIHHPVYIVQLLQSSYRALAGVDVPNADLLIEWPEPEPTDTPVPTLTPTPTPDTNLPPVAEIGLRSVSPYDEDTEAITTGLASGLPVVGVDTTVYLLGNGSDPEGSDITAYDWSIEGPALSISSTVRNATFQPPREGWYQASLRVTDASGAVSVKTTKEIVSARWTGIRNCASCHDGSLPGLGDQVTGWQHTGHASMLARNINDTEGHLAEHCISCHTVGYDTDAFNGGFDDVAAQTGWTFPSTLEPGNWENIEENYPELANLSNIQCENCHGPGGLHFGDTSAIGVSLDAGSCAVCHDAPTHHIKNYEWDTSNHADPVVEESASCAPCHSGWGFVSSHDPSYAEVVADFAPISCGVCHDPHAHDHEYQVRVADDVTLGNGEVVTEEEAGLGTLCINCHKSRRDVNEYVQEYHRHFGPHHGPQGDMLKATGGYEWEAEGDSIDVYFIPHLQFAFDACVDCHLAEAPEEAPPRAVGGHTFRLFAAAGSIEGVTEDVSNLTSCNEAGCHYGRITDLNRTAWADYDGDGEIEGIQDEVQGLLDVLGMELPPLGSPEVDVTEADYSGPENDLRRKAAYNWEFVTEDRSGGVHNTTYTLKLLQKSYRHLTGHDVPGAVIR